MRQHTQALGLCGCLLWGLIATVSAAEGFANLSTYGALGANDPLAQSMRVQGLLEGNHEFTAGVRVHAQARIETDARDLLEPGRPDPSNRSQANRRWLIGTRGAAELEELYADAKLGGWNLRAGKQQTVWGTSDGLKVLDIVNPQSFREYILDDYERSRIPLWSVSAVRSFGERNAIEFVVIPDLSFHDIPETGALFEITSPQLTPQGGVQPGNPLGFLVDRVASVLLGEQPGVDPFVASLGPALLPLNGLAEPLLRPALIDLLTPRIVERTQRPQLAPETLEFGARLRGGVGEFEGALCVLRHHSDVPSVIVDIDGDQIEVLRRYVQTTSFGLQLSRPVGATLLRFEGVYGTRAPIPAPDLEGDALFAIAPSYGGVIGIDLPVRDAGLLSVQLGELGLLLDERNYDVPDRNPFATILLRDEIIPNRLTGEAFSSVSLERGDLMLRARLLWMLHDRLTVQFGLDAFEGDRRGVFGQFDDRDRVSIELSWSV